MLQQRKSQSNLIDAVLQKYTITINIWPQTFPLVHMDLSCVFDWMFFYASSRENASLKNYQHYFSQKFEVSHVSTLSTWRKSHCLGSFCAGAPLTRHQWPSGDRHAPRPPFNSSLTSCRGWIAGGCYLTSLLLTYQNRKSNVVTNDAGSVLLSVAVSPVSEWMCTTPEPDPRPELEVKASLYQLS